MDKRQRLKESLERETRQRLESFGITEVKVKVFDKGGGVGLEFSGEEAAVAGARQVMSALEDVITCKISG